MNSPELKRAAWALCLAAYADGAWAGEEMTGATVLDPVRVESPRLERDWLSTPAALSVVAGEDLDQGRQHLQMDEQLARVPGVFTQNRFNYAQDLRLSIRGFGARSAFGIRGVKLIVDGIPETVVDGQSQTDAIDLTSVTEMEVIRGPASALYGNATGGVLDIDTFDPPPRRLTRLRLDAGSFGYDRQSVQAGRQYEDWGYAVSAYSLDYDGYRGNNAAERKLANGKFNIRLGGDASLQGVVRLLDAPVSEDPGGLTLEQVRENRRQARPANLRFDSHQAAEQRTFGLVYRDPVDEDDEFSARVFHTRRDLTQLLPFESGGIVTFDRAFFGGGLQYRGDLDAAGLPGRFTAGVDVEKQEDDRRRFDNDEGEYGDLSLDQMEEARAIGVYARHVLPLGERFELTTGLRYDDIRFEIDDRFPVSPTNPDESGRRDYEELSGSLALGYALSRHHRLYATVGTAFETPTFTEFANPAGGGFNPDLQPQEAINYEVGARGFLHERARYSLALFRVEVEDELVPFDVPGDNTDRDFFENAGESVRNGLEAQVEVLLGKRWSSTLAFTYSDFEFEEFVDSRGNDFAGERLPGIPESQLFAELAYRSPGAFFAILDASIHDELYADNANDVKVAGYGLVNARIGIEERLGRHALTLFFGVSNLLDEEYFTNIRINAFGGRYYEPAPGRNLYAGVKLEL